MRPRAGVFVLAVILAGCSSSGGGGDTTLSGSIYMGEGTVSNIPVQGNSCDDNPTADRSLTFKDASGNVIGTATSVGVDAEQVTYSQDLDTGVCHYTGSYEVSLPSSDFYTIEIQGSSNPPETISRADLEAAGFVHDLHLTTIGG